MNDYIIKEIIWEFIKKNKFLVITILFTSLIVYTINSIYIPLILVNISNSEKKILNENILKLIYLWIISQIIYSLYEYYLSKLDPLLNKFISNIILEKVFNKYKYDYLNINSSELFNKIKTIQYNISILIERIISIMIPRFLILFFIIFNIYNINTKIGFYLLFIFIIFIIFIIYKSHNNINIIQNENNIIDNINLKLDDKIKNIQIISSISQGINNEIKECDNLTNKILDISLKTTKETSYIKIIPNIFNSLILGLILYQIKDDNKIKSDLIIKIILSIFPLFEHLSELAYFIPDLIYCLGVLKHNDKFITNIFKSNNYNYYIENYEFNNFNIYFNNVTFYYKSDKILLDNFSTNINFPSHLLLYGKSGSGKTSFIKLLLGINKTIKGDIFIDNYNIKNIDHDTIFKYISYLPQSLNTLFDDTLYYNLSYGNNLTKEKMNEFLNNNNIDDIFSNLKIDKNDYMEYNVGLYGTNLSGGQRQVVNIIRTILNNKSKIVILDEPTIGLDINYKHKIINLIKNFKEKTIIIISHDEFVLNQFNNKIKFDYLTNPII